MSDKFNLLRKIFHFSGILIVITYYGEFLENVPGNYFIENTRSILFYFFLVVVIVMGIIEFLRFRISFIQGHFVNLTKHLLKPHEVERLHASVPFFLGLVLSTGFFMKEIAILSSLFLMIGDPCAAWFGGKYGTHKLSNGKSYEGLVAGILGAFLAGLAFLLINLALQPDNFYSQLLKTSPVFVLLVLLIGAIMAFVAELYSRSGFFDDNLVIPVVSGLVLSIGMMAFFNLPASRVFFSLKDLILPK